MTSNLGSEKIQSLSEEGEDNYQTMKLSVMGIVAKHFRPELLNRIDDVVVFRALQQEQLIKIADIQIEQLRQRLVAQGFDLELSQSAKQIIVDAGYDPVYGARPLRRAVQHYLENPLAQKLLAGDLSIGCVISVDVNSARTLEFTAVV